MVFNERDGRCSVVIPTTLRPSVAAAIDSVLAQRGVEAEIICVVDRHPAECGDIELSRVQRASRVLFTGGGKGAAHARNLGSAAASSTWCAFLDDDDTWAPDKLSVQIAYAVDESLDLVSCQFAYVDNEQLAIPARGIAADERVEDYLFRSRGPRAARNMLHTSTLVARTELCKTISWNPQLKRHQDWDWLLRAQARRNLRLGHVERSLVAVSLGSAASISSGDDWVSSLAWARSWRSTWAARTYADFLAGQVLRYALAARSGAGVAAVARELRAVRAVPCLASLLLGASGVVPRRRFEQRMLASKPRQTGAGQ